MVQEITSSKNFNQKLQRKISKSMTLTSRLMRGWGWCSIKWMDELGFYVPSTVFQSLRDDGRMNMKGSVQ